MPLYLSHLVFNYQNRDARRDLADCHKLHSRLLTAFPHPTSAHYNARAQHGLLYRIETSPHTEQIIALAQSHTPPDWDNLPPTYLDEPANTKQIDTLLEHISAHDTYRFRLDANPTKKIDTKTGPDGRRKNGRRVPLRNETDFQTWIVRKAGRHGFHINDLTSTTGHLPDLLTVPHRVTRGKRPHQPHQRITFRTVRYEGHLTVTNPTTFRDTLAHGIGPAKAFGHGLLSLASAGIPVN